MRTIETLDDLIKITRSAAELGVCLTLEVVSSSEINVVNDTIPGREPVIVAKILR